ncbi:cysteine peptidase family C39 domain-containing protein [Metamycoplasma hyosynoviae]|nr:cysteine peptidase family C39 domain-containing protein [Metamycoplasma hyosynoviae]
MRLKMQLDEKDCGLIVLQGFYKMFYKKWLDINLLKQKINYGQNGISLYDLNSLALKLGISLNVMEGDFESFLNLKIDGEFFTIINDNNYYHYVVVEEKTQNHIYINDPAKGKIKIPIDEFKSKYLNIVITVSKSNTEDLSYTSKNFKNDFLVKNIGYVILITFISFLSQALFFASSFFIKYIVDKVIVEGKNDLLIKISLVFGWIIVLRLIANLFNTILRQNIFSRIRKEILELFFRKTLNGKSEMLEKISKSDFMQRLSTIDQISHYYANIINLVFCNLVSIILIFLGMGSINWRLLLISITFVLISIAISFIFNKRVHRQYPKIVSNNIEIINKNLEIFLNNIYSKNPTYKTQIVSEVQNNIKTLQSNNFALWKTINIKDLASKFLNVIVQFIVVYLGTKYVIYGDITLGDFLLFNTIISFLVTPSDELVEIIINSATNKENISRLNFILFIEEESESKDKQIIGKIQSIKFEDFSFAYNVKNIFENFNIEITENKIVDGKNGIGKTTLFKLIFGIYNSYEGNILVNGVNIKDIDLQKYREKIFINSNNVYFPNQYILEYITCNNKFAINRFKLNIEKYKLDKLLNNFNLRIDEKITSGGMFLSSGQRQLLNILKLFCFEYDVILLDEALENIDKRNWKFLKKAISNEQKNAIFIETSHCNRYINKSDKIYF